MTILLVKWIFVILHVITAAAWFGLGLRLGGRARAVTNARAEAAQALADDAAGTVRLMNIFVVLTLVFGLCAFFAGGGFAAYSPVYHTSILLIVVLVSLQLFLIRPAWNRLQSSAGSEDSGALESARKRIAMSTGIGHLCWLVMLVLMFWNKLAAAF